MKQAKQKYRQIVFIIVAVMFTSVPCFADKVSQEEFVGHWEGSAKVIVTWCGKSELPIILEIRSDGSVVGKIGDSELEDGQLKVKRSWFGKHDNGQTTHIIRGELVGPIVSAEDIERDRVFVHLRLDKDELAGSVTTSGSKVGGKETMSLTAMPLNLTKS